MTGSFGKFDLATLRHHYSLIPLFVAGGFGMCLAAEYTIRLATRNPDVSSRRKSNPEPWQHLVDEKGNRKQYKFSSAPEGLHKFEANRPKNDSYGVPNFPPERPPIEKLWAEYQVEHAQEDHHH